MQQKERIGMENIEQLEQAFAYAAVSGSFHKMNLVEQAEHVCVYGLGTYFEEAFLRQNVRERFRVDFVCDANFEKAKSIVARPEYTGLKAIALEELADVKNVYVIVMLGNPLAALEDIGKRIGPQNCGTYNDVALDNVLSAEERYRSREEFILQKEEMFRVYHMLKDERSRWIYTNVICNRIAPQFSNASYGQMCQKPQYFPQDLSVLADKKIIVDGGAYTGDTLISFLQEYGGSFEAYHAFELDMDNYHKLLEQTRALDADVQKKIRCYRKGLWDENCRIAYGRCASDDSYSIFNGAETQTAEVVRLDDCLAGEKVTFIKMDIEGSEQQALMGAEEIISGHKPVMAICVYHRLEDIWKIPLLLKKMVPEYKLAIRHHAEFWVSETVCYAYV